MAQAHDPTSASALTNTSTAAAAGGKTTALPAAHTFPQLAERDTPPNQTLYISHLCDSVKAPDVRRLLHTLFGREGLVLDVVLLPTRRMRGQAHVVMADVSSATRALKALQGATVLGRQIRIAYARGKSYAVAKLDGTYTPYVPGQDTEDGAATNGVKRKREQDDVDEEDEDDE